MDGKTIRLTKGQVALVDEEDFESLSQYSWQATWNPASRTFYATRSVKRDDGRRTKISMHRVILGVLKSPEVLIDHRNHDGLDNRRHNLRVCSVPQNSANMRKRTGMTSKFKGVCWHKQHEQWAAAIYRGGKRCHLGYFDDEVDAARAYNNAAVAMSGEFARLNPV